MENFVNYKAVNKQATMEEYTEEMNRQVEFDEFLSILRTATVEEANSPMFRHQNQSKFDKDASAEDYIMTEMFMQ